jgi:hypothetical protein
MKKSEFWTQTPLPSISVSDSHFRNVDGNNWSGPPEGLTFQRAIRALENYGHHAELVLVGALQKRALLTTGKFPQQINPFTSVGHNIVHPCLPTHSRLVGRGCSGALPDGKLPLHVGRVWVAG